ncbi:hypothetical protein ACWC4D_34100 [Streptomyces sp. NPDC001288]|uniref:hypothetical protein n=1 Tax=unclassified Streptomyces TaxID=2593676 RepID=UPI00332312B2
MNDSTRATSPGATLFFESPSAQRLRRLAHDAYTHDLVELIGGAPPETAGEHGDPAPGGPGPEADR